MTADRDKNESFKRGILSARKRTLHHLMQAMERQALRLAILARQGAARRSRGRQPALFNPVTQLRREIMPLITQLAELAAGGPLPPEQPPKKSGRRKPSAKTDPSRDEAAAAEAAPPRADEKTPASV